MPKKLTIEEFQAIASEHGGKCLSKNYVNSETKLKFECDKGHRWTATPPHIKHSKSWCPTCFGKKKKNIEEMQSLANKRGGKCLSKKYESIDKKLKWECIEGHQWETAPISIIHNNTWCRICAGKEKHNIGTFKAIAKVPPDP